MNLNDVACDSEVCFKSLCEAMPTGVFLNNLANQCIFTNQFLQTLGGFSSAEALGEGFLRFIHPEDRERILKERLRSPEAIGVLHYQLRFLRADQTIRWVCVRTAPVFTREGQCSGYVGTVEDVTEHRQIEQALQSREAQLAEAQQLAQLGSWQHDSATGEVSWSAELWRIFGLAPRAVGPSFEELLTMVHPQDRHLLETLNERSRQKGAVFAYDYRIVRPDGSLRWLRAQGRVVVDDCGRAVKAGGTDQDITDRKQAEEKQRESDEWLAANLAATAIANVRLLEQEREQELKLQQSQKMEAIGTLAGGVAHDFNNLLTVILGNTELAINKLQVTDPVRQRLEEVDKAGKRAAVLTRQLLAFGRRQQMERRNIKLNDVIAEIMKLLNRIIGADVEVNVRAGPNLSTIFADPAQIEQVVMNLAVNARDAMPEGGRLTIETSNVTLDEAYQRQYPDVQPGNYVELRVSDTGSGMDEATRARIFEPFFTTKEVGKGTGLGLPMVYGIVKQHDGYINVYSEPGYGTAFKIILPVVSSAVDIEDVAVQPEALGGTETILLAEDDEGLRNLASEVLSDLGYSVLLANDGEEAVQMYLDNQERVDLLLLDVMMPRLGGPEAYDRIREMAGEIPMIFMTGYSSEMVQRRFEKQNIALGGELGAMIIQKPYNIDGLGRKIREVLDASQTKVIPMDTVSPVNLLIA